MAAKEDDGSANDLHFGPITIDVPDDLSDIKRDLKFYQKVGEAYDSRKVGKAASALLFGQKFGYTSADKVVGRILEKTGFDKKDIGRKSQKFEDASKRFTESLEGDLTRQSAHDLAKTLDSKITTLRIAISGVDFICKALFGVSPIDEWVRKPFFGDWDELRDTAGKWQSLAETLPEVQTALLEISNSLDETVWSGQAADIYVVRNEAVADALVEAPEPCSEMAQALNALADNAEKTLNLIFDTLSEIISLLKLIAGELIIPGAGPVLATVTVAAEVTQAIQWASDIVEYLNNLYEALNGLCVCLMVMQRLSVKTEGMLSVFGGGTSNGGTGSTSNDVAFAGASGGSSDGR